MINSLLPALIAFGGLLAIAVTGLVTSNTAAGRLNGSSQRPDGSTAPREEPSRFTEFARR